MSPDFAKGYVCQIILALDYLHERGVVHGDLKPENLLMTSRGYMKLADFGLARRLEASSDSQPNTLFGTPFYMAPEMIDGSSCGPSIDWWALGVILYQALFARYPFDLERLPHSHHKFSRGSSRTSFNKPNFLLMLNSFGVIQMTKTGSN